MEWHEDVEGSASGREPMAMNILHWLLRLGLGRLQAIGPAPHTVDDELALGSIVERYG